MNNELKLIGRKELETKNIVDTLEIARNKFPGSLTSLDALCKRFRIDNSRRKKHTAIIDCELLAKVYINLLDQKEPKLNFNEKVSEKSKMDFKENQYSKKILTPSKDELDLHTNFLKLNLKKNFY